MLLRFLSTRVTVGRRKTHTGVPLYVALKTIGNGTASFSILNAKLNDRWGKMRGNAGERENRRARG